MQVHYLGHSGFLIQDLSYCLLVDPWLSDTSFMSNWERFPKVPVDPYKFLNDANKVDLWCSHAHSDHYDKEFIRELKLFTKKKSIAFRIISQDYMAREYNKLDDSLHILPLKSEEWYQPSEISTIKIYQIPENPSYTCHASLVIDNLSTRFIHGNDAIIDEQSYAKLNTQRLEKVYYSGQYSLVSPFPANQINLSDHLRKELSEKHLARQAERFTSQMQILGADVGILCAGPADISRNSFVNRTIQSNDIDLYKITQKQFRKIANKYTLPKRIVLPVAGKNIVNAHASFTLWEREVSNNSRESIKALINQEPINKMPHCRTNESFLKFLNIQFKSAVELFNAATKMNLSLLPELFFGVEIDNAYLLIDHAYKVHKVTNLDLEHLCNILCPTNPRVYIIIFGDKSLQRWLSSSYFNFEDSWYGHDVVSLQAIESYSAIIFNLLAMMHSRPLLQEYVDSMAVENDNYINYDFDGKSYLRKKYCPHRGADLSKCAPDKLGHLVCPAHGWIYNIESGKCIDGDPQSSIS